MIPHGTGRSLLLVGFTSLLIYIVFFSFMYPLLPDFELPLYLVMFPGALATALVCMIVWWHFLVKPNRFTIGQSVLAGAICGIVAHPVIWLSIFSMSTLGEQFSIWSWITIIPTALYYSLLSLTIFGVITTAIGALAGPLLLLVQRMLHVVPPRSTWDTTQKGAGMQEQQEVAQQIMM